ncbi:hypothetical protein CLU83_4212 [Flavobacterium sp. 1]|uniref:hypothetical protein n=1 Tax=Flavobacterium sp. 1 TaxID=2035200 RepID=UPI000C233A9B|nr:hypothetical protein [Flavobacterium sp. 1]PJJ10750.1 hypothetical protein CLU83_4212 [Flavobacterium sp. 1]
MLNQTSSEGLSSGEYGGRKANAIFLVFQEISPYGKHHYLKLVGILQESSLKNIWKFCPLHCDNSITKLSPFIGENAPKI